MQTIIVLVVLALLAGYIITIYNGLVSLKHNVSKYLANIDVTLKQRHDELPKLIATCKQYMEYEQETLTKVVSARQAVATAQEKSDIKALGLAETQMRQGLGSLFALAESYPDLKANNAFTQLHSRISGLENTIADRRELYNEAVNNNNIRIEQFPDSLIANFFKFKTFDLLEFDKAELSDIDVNQLFKS